MSTSTVNRNIRVLVLELFWAAIATAGYSFAAAFVIRLGGSNLMVGLLTSAAAVVNMLTTIPFAALMERTSNRKPWIIGSLIAFRMLHIGLIFVPWLPAYQAEAIVLILLVANLPVALFNAGWLPMFGEIIPLHRRAKLFSARNVTLGATMMVATYGFGRFLDHGTFPGNYQVVFVVAFVMSMLSTWYVAQIDMPEVAISAPRDTAQPLIWWTEIAGLFKESRGSTAITINTVIFNLAPWAAIALQPIYFVRELGATDEWLGIWFAITNGGAIIGNIFWPRLMERYGFQRVMIIAAILSSGYFFAIGLVPKLTIILVFALLIVGGPMDARAD